MIIKSVDLFAGVGGLRIGLEKALKKLGIKHNCVLYSEINKHCQKTYNDNFPNTKLIEDIKNEIPEEEKPENLKFGKLPN